MPQRNAVRRIPRFRISLWITCGLLWTTCGSVWWLPGCGDDSGRGAPTQPAPPPVENVRAEPEPEPEPEPELEPLPDDLPEPTEEEQLEADCFAGDQAACDRLGH